jgi:putative phosphoesterase
LKILIVSDTHRYTDDVVKVIKKVAPFDLLVHCGDAEVGIDTLERLAGCPVKAVAGNNDYGSDLPAEAEFMLGKYKVWLVHGHRHFVHIERGTLRREAERRGADIVMFGHTHRPSLEITPELTALNPGSLSYPRQEGRRPSYIIMEIDKNGEAHYTVAYLKG